jgi:hypothetical protein
VITRHVAGRRLLNNKSCLYSWLGREPRRLLLYLQSSSTNSDAIPANMATKPKMMYPIATIKSDHTTWMAPLLDDAASAVGVLVRVFCGRCRLRPTSRCSCSPLTNKSAGPPSVTIIRSNFGWYSIPAMRMGWGDLLARSCTYACTLLTPKIGHP